MTADHDPIEHAFHLPKAERPPDEQQLKAAAVKSWQSISREETPWLMISGSH